MKPATIRTLREARAAGRALVRVVDLASGDERVLAPADAGDPVLRDALASAVRRDRSETVEIGGRRLFLQVFNPPLALVIVGAVHIAQVLSRMGALAGYAVTVIDPRKAFATDARFPDVTLMNGWPDEELEKVAITPRTAIVALTHDPKLDDPALAAALKSDAFYVGALGSKRTHATRLERLRAHGLTDAQLARIKGPVGLAIGAISPGEIAVSILAEMTQELRQVA